MNTWFTRVLKFKSGRKNDEKNVGESEMTKDIDQISTDEDDYYISDAPVSDPVSEDKLNRWLFAQRIAQTIASRKDPNSIVIGIYGVWGEGKSSILNFVERELNESSHVIVVRFNPWLFTDEVHLLQSFFKTLADALGKSISSKKVEIGKILQKYGTILSGFSLNVGVTYRKRA